jgi:putative membrane protein
MNKPVLSASLCIALFLAAPGFAFAQPAPDPSAPGSSASITQLNSEDRGFLTKAAESGYMEIAGGKLALKKSRNAQVKQFAQKMIDEHTRLGEQIQALVKKKGYETPTQPSLVQAAKLKALELRDDGFDEAYGDEIGVAAHEDAIELFEEAAGHATDNDLKRFAADTLPLLKRHLDMARALRKAIKAPAS